ncbi:MAG: metallophosphoesterase family protein [Nitrososphaeria archaeon]
MENEDENMTCPSTVDKKNCWLFEFRQNQSSSLRRLIAVGDLHGDLESIHSLSRMFNPRTDVIIFLGDYADRGTKGIEVIEAVDTLIKKHPDNIVALKGNHEDYTQDGQPLFSPCDLIYEAETKKGGWRRYFEHEFKPFKEKLYLAAILPKEYLFVHGGVSNKMVGLHSLRKPSKEVEMDILWSDPFKEYGEYPNLRGAGVYFGEDITVKICSLLNVKRVIRSHEPPKAARGPFCEHSGRVITISTTSVYGGKPFVLMINLEKPSELSYTFL